MLASMLASRNATFVSIAITVVTSGTKRSRQRFSDEEKWGEECSPFFKIEIREGMRGVVFWHAGLEDY